MHISPLKWHFCLHGEPENYFLNARSIYHICTLIHCHCTKLINTGQSCFYRSMWFVKMYIAAATSKQKRVSPAEICLPTRYNGRSRTGKAEKIQLLHLWPSSHLVHPSRSHMCSYVERNKGQLFMRSSVEQRESFWVTGRGTYWL